MYVLECIESQLLISFLFDFLIKYFLLVNSIYMKQDSIKHYKKSGAGDFSLSPSNEEVFQFAFLPKFPLRLLSFEYKPLFLPIISLLDHCSGLFISGITCYLSEL